MAQLLFCNSIPSVDIAAHIVMLAPLWLGTITVALFPITFLPRRRVLAKLKPASSTKMKMWGVCLPSISMTLWTYWFLSCLTCSELLSKGTVYNGFILTWCFFRILEIVVMLTLWIFAKVTLFAKTPSRISGSFIPLFRMTISTMAVSCTSVSILPFPLVWDNHWVLSGNAKTITHKFIYFCNVQLSQMPLQNTSYLLVCRKTLTIDATVERCRFGCTLWPASLIERPWFTTWSITVALISSETTALDLPLILLPPRIRIPHPLPATLLPLSATSLFLAGSMFTSQYKTIQKLSPFVMKLKEYHLCRCASTMRISCGWSNCPIVL